MAARRSDVIVAPSTAMRERIVTVMPDLSSRVVVRLHPVSVPVIPRLPGEPVILCPVLFASQKQMPQRLTELLTAVGDLEDPSVRVQVTAYAAEVPAAIACHPQVELVGRLPHSELREMWARSRAIYFPTALESFGYPLAEARVSGLPVIARDTALNREIAGPALCRYTLGDPDSLRRAVEVALTADVAPDPEPFDPDQVFRVAAGAASMTRLGLRPYQAGDDPPPDSVPVSVVILTLNEEPNIRRCLASVAWADQVMVVDSGSADRTVPLARAAGAEVVDQPWLGFSAQREYALRLPLLRHDWVYFVDADEWVSPQLATEIAMKLADPQCAGFAHRLRLVFMGTWIRHCGWYPGSWVVRLVDRRYTKYDGSLVGERACVDGRVGRLDNDIVDEDRKGLAAWLHKHVRYAELECEPRQRRLACCNGCARCGTATMPGRSPAASSRSWSSPGSRPSPLRSSSTCTSRGSASSTVRPGSASALPRLVRDERSIAPGGGPCPREGRMRQMRMVRRAVG